jgi:P pilus assembly chaperone PapD
LSVRQNLPVVIHPKSLAFDNTPWTHLKWQLADGKLRVSNDTPYVVRLSQEVELLPGGAGAMLPKPYLLPGDVIEMPVPASSAQATRVKISPASVYGYVAGPYEAALSAANATEATEPVKVSGAVAEAGKAQSAAGATE